MIMSVPTSPRDRRLILISVVLPVYNERAILRELTDQLRKTLESGELRFEIVYVNDGSGDGSSEILDELSAEDTRIAVVHLSRNFGHQAAVHAGLEHAAGDVVIVMDSDLQDDPKAIPRFLDCWEFGADVVYAQRFNRKENIVRRLLFYSFYRVLNAIADSAIPTDAGNFGLMDRKVVNAVLLLPERERFFPGLRHWAGFRQMGIPVERAARHDARPRVSLTGLFRLAKTAVFSFSAFPLTFFYIIAALSAAVCAGSVGFVLWHKVMTGLAIPGWASTIITASFFGALNALGISILGEYVFRTYDQVRNRPVYLTGCTRNGTRSVTANPDRRSPSNSVDRLELLLEQLENEYRASGSTMPAPSGSSKFD